MTGRGEMARIARRRASEARGQLNLSAAEPVRDIFGLFADEGIYLVRYPFDMQNISGLYMEWHERPLVVVDSAHTLGHQVFTAAHELCHVRYEHERPYSVCSPEEAGGDERDKVEVACDSFAAEFLMPEDGIDAWLMKRTNGVFKTPGLREVISLQQHLGVSFQATLYRLLRVGILSTTEYDELQAETQGRVIHTARRFGFDDRLYVPDRSILVPPTFVEYATIAYDRDEISWGRLNELLARAGVSAEELELKREVTPGDAT